jgi:hypothetical protein
MVLGPRDSATLPLFQMAGGLLCLKPGSRTKELSWVGVGDLVRALRVMMAHWTVEPTELIPTFFVCSAPEITDRELIRTTAQIVGGKGFLLPLPDSILRLVGVLSRWFPAIGAAVPSLQPDRLQELLESRWVVTDAAFRETFLWKSHDALPGVITETARWLHQTGQIKLRATAPALRSPSPLKNPPEITS